ncbi:unnamed protein product [Adineta ricciae]|uniref:Uncharacterized protein n=1 Tax=Adineta ricciae TaxID=249248 RepID=A0A815SFJ7_ADIRI|nr:unnamed protein product [Adineta ricciae]CAF1612950.1 unnamed protein product [Adineta ricciae]
MKTIQSVALNFDLYARLEPLCLLKYEQVLINSSCSFISSCAVGVTDVTAHNHIDLIYHCDRTEMVHVLLGNSKCSCFQRDKLWIHVADLNSDNRADLILGYYSNELGKTNVTLVFGNGNGTFQTQTRRSFL